LGTAPLPLLSVDYDLAHDRANHATGGTSTFRVFQASLPAPPATGFVSLRVTAAGDAGSGIDQTIMHAYAGAAV
jgi:hypothetical protein